MPDIKFGVAGLNNTIFNTGNTNSVSSVNQGASSALSSVRVKSIILDDSHPQFNNFGQWNSIGTIFFEDINQATPDGVYDVNNNAKPIFPNIKQYPLINEITYLLQLTNNNIATNLSSNSYYYFPPLNIWNSQIHNAIPSYDNDPSNDAAQQADYVSSFQGEVKRVKDNSSDIDLGKTFKENPSIHPLLPYEGDTIYEGRFGNSIRLGATVNDSFISNNWSSTGSNGDPITILRNGQTNYNSDPWVPEVENINTDKSSIYLTSTQQLPLQPASNNNDSFSKSTPPIGVSQYSGNQIVLNSGRLVLNAKTDSIVLKSNQQIQLSSNDTVGIDGGKQITLSAPKIYLGSSDGVEGTKIQSLVLGENLNAVLGEIAGFLSTLDIAFKNAIDSNGVPISSLQSIANNAKTLSNDINNIVKGKNLLSKTVKTI